MTTQTSPVSSPRAQTVENVPALATADQPPPRLGLAAVLDVVLVIIFLGLTFLLGAFPLKDADIFWHLRTGQLIRETGQVPRTDIFTYTREGAPWIDLHWLFQVGVSWLYDRWGVVALNLAKCIVTTIAVMFLVTARRRDWPFWAMLTAWLPALLLLGGRMYVRPETLSLLYLSIFLAVICRWDRRPWLVVLLPLVQVIWVNSHGLFVLGPIVLSFALIDAFLTMVLASMLRRAAPVSNVRWWRIVGFGSLATFAVCLLNPYGIRGAVFPIVLAGTMTNQVFSKNVAELWSIPHFIKQAGLANLPLQLHLFSLALGVLSFLVPFGWWVSTRVFGAGRSVPPSAPTETASDRSPGGRRTNTKKAPAKSPRKKGGKSKPEPDTRPAPPWSWAGWLVPFRLLLFAAFSYLSFQATRNSHQFAAVAGTVTAWNLGEWAAAVHRRRMHRTGREATEATSASLAPRVVAGLAILIVAAWVGSGLFYRMTGEGRTIGLGEEPLFFAHDAARFAGRPEMPERFVSFHNAHASLFEFYNGPGRKVFTDPRLEVAGAELFRRYIELDSNIKQGVPGWQAELDRIGRPIIMVDHEFQNPLDAATLLTDAHWRCVWFDPIVSVFVHDSAVEAVRRHEVDFAQRHFRQDATRLPTTRAEHLAYARVLRTYVNAISSHRTDLIWPLLWLGEDHCRQLLKHDPESAAAWKYLGQTEIGRDPPFPPSPRYRLPFDPAQDLSTARAIYALRRARDLAPDDVTTLVSLDEAYERQGMHEAALEVLDRVALLLAHHPAGAGELGRVESGRQYHLGKLGDPINPSWGNLAELDQVVTKLLATGRAATAAEVLEKANPPERSSWAALDRLATLRLHLGEPTRARSLWRVAAKTAPDPAVATARIAVTYLVEENPEAARTEFRLALETDPRLFEATYGLAVLEQDAGNAQAAFELATKAAALAPDDRSRESVALMLRLLKRFATNGDR